MKSLFLKTLFALLGISIMSQSASGQDSVAGSATNELGVDLHKRLAKAEPDKNLCLSPYSIQNALAMTFAGAEGETRAQMSKTLHYPNDGAKISDEFVSLRYALLASVQRSEVLAANAKKFGGPNSPIQFSIANRLFGRKGYEFREPFLTLVKEKFEAPLEPMDFSNSIAAAEHINSWVESKTQKRIKQLIPPNAIDPTTRLVLVNALYFKAAWASHFRKENTKDEPFKVRSDESVNVPTMISTLEAGYARKNGYQIITLNYIGNDLQFVIILPDDHKGLADLEQNLTSEKLAECAIVKSQEISLHLPKFKIEPPTLSIGSELKAMGMPSAFDQPIGSANFNGMALRGQDYLYISQVLHKTFLALDEDGTEAAAATAVVMSPRGAFVKPKEPVEVRADHPFLYAIQHKPSGVCLFLGRIVDPR